MRRAFCLLLLSLLPLTSLGCWPRPNLPPPSPSPFVTPDNSRRLLIESWNAYRQRFIQGDGRVIDWESDQKSTSEGQAYALWRSVLVNDPDTFERSLRWAEINLRRLDAKQQPIDSLWAWRWGQNNAKQWAVIDPNFASDADIDACFALILAADRWNRPDYLALARQKLKDLWQFSTVDIRGKRYLLPGPTIAFQKADLVTLNPSYLAPYAFRLFAKVDGDRDWQSLVDSSYEVLNQSAALSAVGLPSDWVGLETKSGQYRALAAPLISQYGFDASRVWWRVALDSLLAREPRANEFLTQHLKPIQTMWRSKQSIPARIDLKGRAQVNYDATSQYGMIYSALQLIDPAIAQEIYQQKLLSRYREGFWDNNSAYYTQNLVWFGIIAPSEHVTLFTDSLAIRR